MEITRVPLSPTTAPRAKDAAPDARAAGRAAEATANEIAQRRELNEALAEAILKQSDVPVADFSKVRVRLDVHTETGRLVAAIENKETGELVQTIPSETILRGAAMLERVIGTVLDRPA